MKNLKVGTRILLSFCLILSMLIGLTLAVSMYGRKVVAEVNAVAVNNMFSIAANDLLDKFNDARASANVFFTQSDSRKFQQTADAIEQTQTMLEKLNGFVAAYPQYLSVYEPELDDIGKSISVYMSAFESVNAKRKRQDELRVYLLYSSRQVHRMFQQLYSAQYDNLLAEADAQLAAIAGADDGAIDLTHNIEQIRLIHELNEAFTAIEDDMHPLLYQNDISNCDEIVIRLDEYRDIIHTLRIEDNVTMRAIAVSSASYIEIYRRAFIEYTDAVRDSTRSVEIADNAQSNLQAKTTALLVNVDTATRSLIDGTKANASSTLSLVIAGSAVAVVLGLILAFLVTRSITQPVEKMVAAARRLAMGDANLELDISSRDEVGRLAAQMQEMIVSVKEREKTLNFKSEHDLLTGLFNKMTTAHLINQFLIEEFSQDEPNTHALFFIDLDNFKPINDILGHDYGDRVLIEFADRLRAFFRSNDILGRVGGDEFVVLVKNMPNRELAEKRAEEACEALRKTYYEQDREFVISASIGVCFFSAHGSNFDELSKSADQAMYIAKRGGKDSFHVHE